MRKTSNESKKVSTSSGPHYWADTEESLPLSNHSIEKKSSILTLSAIESYT